MNSKLPNITVVVGTMYLDAGGRKYQVEKLFPHNLYNQLLSFNDIALVKLRDPITFNADVQPLPLAEHNTEAGVELVLSGWGRTSASIHIIITACAYLLCPRIR